mmetsp:Transcript_101204/g.291470  ORF Transcript_101204/g.291470 Transcript_101204/m.291470 type:complete len:248 (+) Transcript_101204:82-825(+)
MLHKLASIAVIAVSARAAGDSQPGHSHGQGPGHPAHGPGAEPSEEPSTTSAPMETTNDGIPWPQSARCVFPLQPRTPFAWDPRCADEGVSHLGCKADGNHQECRFCGEEPYAPCPKCAFESAPLTRVVWDSRCSPGHYTRGCFADGVHFECRFCGDDGLDPCPTTTTTTLTTTITTRSSTTTEEQFNRAMDTPDSQQMATTSKTMKYEISPITSAASPAHSTAARGLLLGTAAIVLVRAGGLAAICR